MVNHYAMFHRDISSVAKKNMFHFPCPIGTFDRLKIRFIKLNPSGEYLEHIDSKQQSYDYVKIPDFLYHLIA